MYAQLLILVVCLRSSLARLPGRVQLLFTAEPFHFRNFPIESVATRDRCNMTPKLCFHIVGRNIMYTYTHFLLESAYYEYLGTPLIDVEMPEAVFYMLKYQLSSNLFFFFGNFLIYVGIVSLMFCCCL